jgi:hypothetical protein
MKENELTYIYHGGDCKKLTFEFSNGIRSPPAKVYDSEPYLQVKVPKGVAIGSIVFGLGKSRLYTVEVKDDK